MTEDLFLNALRPEAAASPESGIVRVMNHARATGKPYIPLVAGEGHQATPDFICKAATASLERGETFYTHQKGLPELRQALAAYHKRHFNRTMPADRFIVTGSGMQAIQLAIQAVAGAGTEVLLPTPAWPNFAAALGVMGAVPVCVPMNFAENSWSLDPEALEAAITTRTRAIFINSPCNPTGWVANEPLLKALLQLARKHDLWIIADEVYSLFHYSGTRAASFYDIMEATDKILLVNTFSKNWAMTGWRIGWISVPPALQQVFENLVQYSTSGVAAFMQRAAIAALNDGDAFLKAQVSACHTGRDIVCDALAATGMSRFERPSGAFYLFFSLNGFPDTTDLGIRLVDEVGVALSPGEAFGPGGGGFMRLCFARNHDDLRTALDGLTKWLSKNGTAIQPVR
uniref:pyridoxal phosphate-dependent aminotransferase n=1 Tax=Pararhizobium sp. IMCC3301 TaxID=3067904 RepID=UPI0027415F89|nr:pyridoxal phosphate-dependent aminotransferase [Pararhizobium sp. IMCC3301]